MRMLPHIESMYSEEWRNQNTVNIVYIWNIFFWNFQIHQEESIEPHYYTKESITAWLYTTH